MKLYQVVMPFNDHNWVGEYRSPLFKRREDAELFLKKITEMSEKELGSQDSWWAYDWFRVRGPRELATIVEHTVIDEWDGKIGNPSEYLNYIW